MPGSGPANLLSLRKAALRLKIAQHRAQLQRDCEQAVFPLYQADAWLARAKRLRFLWPVLQAMWMGSRGGGAKSAVSGIGKLARWAPVALKIFRAARGVQATYAGRGE